LILTVVSLLIKKKSKRKACCLLTPEAKRNHPDGHLPLTLQAPCTLLSAKSLMYKVLEKKGN